MSIFQAHISGLIKSKFTSYKDFHTLMYTCAAEFDFMELEVRSLSFENPVKHWLQKCHTVFRERIINPCCVVGWDCFTSGLDSGLVFCVCSLNNTKD